MNVEIMNQYRMIVDLGEYGKEEEVFRTKQILDDLKKSLNGSVDGIVADDAEWIDDGQVTVVYGKTADARNDINRVKMFRKNTLGKKGYYTLDEIIKSDLAWVEGFGYLESDEDKQRFESEFKLIAQKK